jgi:zinc transport system ATP-binding protein
MTSLDVPTPADAVTTEQPACDSLVCVRDVSVRFGNREVLRNVSFEVAAGETVGIIGPNGSGKTVLLKCILGLVPHRGEVIWQPGTKIGYVPQKIAADRSLPLNARNLLHAKARTIGAGDESIDEAIHRVGLSPAIVVRPIGQLSGGEFQRMLIAFAILGNPQILILDEPTASIDEPGEEQMFDLLHRLQNEMGIAMIIVSHDVSFVSHYAKRVVTLALRA